MAGKRRRPGPPVETGSRKGDDPRDGLHPRAPLLILIGVVALTFADVFAGVRGLWASDLAAYHIPLKTIFADVASSGGFPFWNPFLGGGQPLAANPAFQTFYPPNLLVLLPPFNYWFQVHMLLHVVAAAIGMYVFARGLNLSRLVSLLGAIAFALGAPYLSLLVRLPLLFSLTWVPWTLASVDWMMRERSIRSLGAASAFFALQGLVGEPTVFAQSVALAAILVAWRADRRERIRQALRLAGAVTIGILLSAVQLLPAFDHARDSVRADGFTWQISSNWSMPFTRLAEVVYPEVFRVLPGEGGQHALSGMYPFRIDAYISEIYLGLLPAVLLIAGLVAWNRIARWSVIAALPFVVLALGSHTPLWRMLYDGGIVSSIRYPEKFILGALFVVLTGSLFLLQKLIEGDRALRKAAIGVVTVWTLVGVAISFSGAGLTDVGPEVRPLSPALWVVALLARGLVLAALFWTAGRHAGRGWIAGAVVFVSLDAAFVHTRTSSRMPNEFFSPPLLAGELPKEKESYRVFHAAHWDDWLGDPSAEPHFLGGDNSWALRNGMFGYRLATSGFASVFDDDIDQTGLRTSEELRAAVIEARKMTGVWPASVLRGANVRYVLGFTPEASRTQAAPERMPVVAADLGPSERYFFAREVRPALRGSQLSDAISRGEFSSGTAYTDASAQNPASGTVKVIRQAPSRIELEVEADGEAFLVAAMTAHKYWRAKIDGSPATLHATNAAFQGLIVPGGKHSIVMTYRNPLVLTGGVISLITLMALLGGIALERRRLVL